LVGCNYTIIKYLCAAKRDNFFLAHCFDVNYAETDDFIYFGSKGLGEKTHHFTLLDGEMVIDTLPDSHKQERRYLIYDLMAINHVSVIEVWFKSYCAK
jgi:hypothetical protein